MNPSGHTRWRSWCSPVSRGIAGVAVLVVMTIMVARSGYAQGPMRGAPPPVPPPSPGLWKKTLLGGQLGPWFSGNLQSDFVEPDVRLSASGTAFHLEFFYQPHLTGILNLDINFGAVSRGDLRATVAGSSTIGNATLYPLGAGLVAFPLAAYTALRLQLLVRAGGSLVIGTEQVEFLDQDLYGIGVGSRSRTAWGYYVGGGAHWLLGTSVALVGNVKYQYVKFDKELFGVRDYSGVQVLIGAAFLYR